MIFFALSFYFVVAVVIATLVFFPDVRVRALGLARRAWRELRGKLFSALTLGERRMKGSAQMAASASVNIRQLIIRRRLLLLASASILATPPLIALSLRGKRIFQFSDTADVSDQKIDALLGGEQLVPPPALPPDVFSTREVEQIRPTVRNASRDWGLLDGDFRQRLLLVYKIMLEQHGYQLVLLEGYRSPARQAALAESGNHVTQAGAGRSYHQYGLAADNAFLRNGKVVISEKDAWTMEGYKLYGQTAQQVGLVWGGKWTFRDFGHVEYHKPGFVLGDKKSEVGTLE